jgi:hypothetical protein
VPLSTSPPLSGAPSLADLARKHGTDKEGSHFYARQYEHHFAHLRGDAIRLLEIGIGGYEDPRSGGESLRMWKEFFPNGTIIGLDLHDKSAHREERIEIERGSQDDPVVLNRVIERHGPFDIVVDDGSHFCAHVIASFEMLFDHVKATGIYAVEDLQTSYWLRYGGSRSGTGKGTSMGFLFDLANGLNYEEFDVAGYRPTRFDRGIESVTFYHNLAFIQKGPNTEGSNTIAPHPNDGRNLGALGRAKEYLSGRAIRNDLIGRTLRGIRRQVR